MSRTISRKKTTIWNLFHLYFNIIIGVIRGFIIIPIYLKFISKDLYGAWLATGNILMWLTIFDPGVGEVATQKVSEAYGKGDKTTIKYVVSSSIIISFLICIVVLIIGLSINNTLINFIRIPQSIDHRHLIHAFNVGIISTAITLFSYSLSSTIIGFQETKLLGFIRNGSSLLAIIINILFLFSGYQLLSISYSGLIAALIQTLAYSILLLKLMKREKIAYAFSFSFLKNYSKIFSITFFSQLFTTISQNIDLLLISRFISVDKVTLVELTRRPIKVFINLITTPSIAMVPSISHLYGEQNLQKLKEIIFKTSLFFSYSLIVLGGGFIAFNHSLVKLWIGNQFYIGNFYNIIIVATIALSTFAAIIGNFTYSMGRIKENSILGIVKNVLSILFLIIFGYFWGLIGILLAGLIVTIFTELWYYPYLLNKTILFNHNQIFAFLKDILASLLGIGLLTWVFFFIEPNSWFNLAFLSVTFIITSLSLFLIISKSVRTTLVGFIKELLRWKY
jgi:O-antigen/teichoic acid export membrane protein